MHHIRAGSNASTLVDACSVAEAAGISIAAAQPTADDCLEGILAHRDDLVAAASSNVNGSAASTSVALPDALQWPPIIAPWPPEDTNSTACPSGEIRSARSTQDCVSCLWGTDVMRASGEHATVSCIGPIHQGEIHVMPETGPCSHIGEVQSGQRPLNCAAA